MLPNLKLTHTLQIKNGSKTLIKALDEYGKKSKGKYDKLTSASIESERNDRKSALRDPNLRKYSRIAFRDELSDVTIKNLTDKLYSSFISSNRLDWKMTTNNGDMKNATNIQKKSYAFVLKRNKENIKDFGEPLSDKVKLNAAITTYKSNLKYLCRRTSKKIIDMIHDGKMKTSDIDTKGIELLKNELSK